MAGVGKTRLAIEFIHRHRQDYPGGLFWLEADSPERLQSELFNLLLELDPVLAESIKPDDSEAVRHQWVRLLADRKKQGPILWCLNNLWEPSAANPVPPISDICPAPESVDLLVTSRLRFRGEIRPGLDQITVEPLGEAASRSLLNSDLESTQQLTAAEAAEVSEWVGGLPIALEILNAGLDYGSLSRQTILDRCRSQEPLGGLEQTLKALEGQVSPGALRGVAETFDLSYQSLSDEAKALARLLSLLAPHPIPLLILENLGEQAGEAERAELISRNLVLRGADPIWGQLHRLMRDFLRQQDGDKDGPRARLVVAVGQVFQVAEDFRDPTHWVKINPYVVHGLELLEQQKSWPESTVSLGNLLGAYFSARGQLSEACELFEQSFNQGRTNLGENHLSTLASMSNLASTLRDLGKFKRAYDLQKLDLMFTKRSLGEEHRATLSSMNNLAVTLKHLGNLKSARSLLEKVLDISRRILGNKHSETLYCMNNLAETLRAQGNLPAARSLQEKVLTLREQEFGEEHLSTLGVMSNLAGTLLAQGDLQGAHDLQQRELTICKRILGEEHPKTLVSLNNLAGTLRAQGDLQGARDLQQSAFIGFRSKLGPDHPHTKTIAINLAGTLLKLGEIEEARDIWRCSGRPPEELAQFLPDSSS